MHDPLPDDSAAQPDHGRRPPPVEYLVGHSPPMQQLRRDIATLGTSDATVLVIGPTGVGKDNVARALHAASPRRRAAFQAVNCGAIPGDLAEAELFGAEAGAYTGAQRARVGRFEQANGGTLLLDEVGELPMALQVKLLRVLETRQLERLGGSRPIPLDIRIMAATNVDLEAAVAAGRFRADLYWRLAVVTLDVPTLAERRDDLSALVGHFARLARVALRLTDCGIAALRAHHWPGNVRELRNLVERAAALGEHVLDGAGVARLLHPRRRRMADWMAAPPAPPASAPPAEPTCLPKGFTASGQLPPFALKALLAEAEAALIAQALEHANGTVAEASRILGLKRTTLVEKLKRLGLHAANEAA